MDDLSYLLLCIFAVFFYHDPCSFVECGGVPKVAMGRRAAAGGRGGGDIAAGFHCCPWMGDTTKKYGQITLKFLFRPLSLDPPQVHLLFVGCTYLELE